MLSLLCKKPMNTLINISMKIEHTKELPAEWSPLARFFGAMRDPTRQKIVLMFDGQEQLCTHKVSHLFAISRAALSHHLRILRSAGIVAARRQGKETFYSLNREFVLGALKTAETYMRTASEQPGADSRVRQNLALVVGLQGRFEEAEKIAGSELSAEQAKANVTYLRGMLAQQNAWSQLKDEDKKKKSNAN